MVNVNVNLTPENNKKVKQHMVEKDFTNKSDAINNILESVNK